MEKFIRSIIIYLAVIMMAVAMIDMSGAQRRLRPEIDYTALVQNIEAGKVAKVTITENVVNGTFEDGSDFTAVIPMQDNSVLAKMQEHGVTVRVQNPPETEWWMSLATAIIPTLIIVGAVYYFFAQSRGGPGRIFSFGRSKARLSQQGQVKVNFQDVAGADEAKEELAEIVEFLKNPQKYSSLGAKIPKGVLLYGAPGTGKTLLAKAVAGEAGVPYFSISGSDFVEMFVGVGASRVRDLFNDAKKNAPCIVFIDEIDAVARQRGAGLGGGHDEREQTLNQLLVEMDGFETNEGIIIIAATNRPDILDRAILRPGRFDRQITVDPPDIKGRAAILNVHGKGKPLDSDVDFEVLARRTPGFTGADLANLVNEAALLSARQNKDKISMATLEHSIERVIAGPEKKSKIISEREKRLTAYHESGHTLVGVKLPNADPVHKVSIIPRGRAGGYTLMLPKEDRNYQTKSFLLDKIATLLAGRVAEEIVLDDISTGASNDIEQATQIARAIVCDYGMSDEMGPVAYGKGAAHQVFLGKDIVSEKQYSEEIAAAIDKEIRRIIEDGKQKARQIIDANRDALERLAAALIERETLDADEIAVCIG